MRVLTAPDLGDAVQLLASDYDLAEPLPAPGPAALAGSGPPMPVPVPALPGGLPWGVRAAEICAAGGHSLLLLGPPGPAAAGVAALVAQMMPALPPDQAAEVTAIHSAAGALDLARPLVSRPPLRGRSRDHGRGDDRRQPGYPAGYRFACSQGRAVPDRRTGIRPVGPGRAAPAARPWPGRHRAAQGSRPVPGPVHPGRLGGGMPLRRTGRRRRGRWRLRVHASDSAPVPGPAVRAAAGPGRHQGHPARRGRPRPGWRGFRCCGRCRGAGGRRPGTGRPAAGRHAVAGQHRRSGNRAAPNVSARPGWRRPAEPSSGAGPVSSRTAGLVLTVAWTLADLDGVGRAGRIRSLPHWSCGWEARCDRPVQQPAPADGEFGDRKMPGTPAAGPARASVG